MYTSENYIYVQCSLFLGELSEVFCKLRHCLWCAVRPPAEGVSARQYCTTETDPLVMSECSLYMERERDTLYFNLNLLTSGVNNCLTKRWQHYALLEDRSWSHTLLKVLGGFWQAIWIKNVSGTQWGNWTSVLGVNPRDEQGCTEIKYFQNEQWHSV